MTEKIIRFEPQIPINDMAQIWIKEYRANRYLLDLSIDELSWREFDIAQNLMEFNGKIGKYEPVFNRDTDGIYRPVKNLDWLKMATEVHAEFHIRNIQPLKFESPAYKVECEKKLSQSSWARRPDLIESSRPSLDRYEIPRMLFRYSKMEFNLELINSGKIQIVPASRYGDETSLNRAQKDIETKMEVRNFGGYFEVDDFYTVCFSSIYRYRMYCEFIKNRNDDSCVVIKDLSEFQNRFNKAIADFNLVSTNPRIAKVISCPVFYYDPLSIENPTTTNEIYLSKHFRYAYQHEFRLVILPTKPQPLETFFLNLGPLHDIAEIVCEQ